MDELHHMQLNHLDLKSQNVLLTTTSGLSATAKITDFGSLRRATAQSKDTRTQTLTVTRTAFLPEDAETRPEDGGVPTRPTEQQALRLALQVAKGVDDPEAADALGGLAALPESKMAQQLSESFQSGAFDDKAEKDTGLGDDSPTADEDICLGTPEWMAPELLDGPKNITRHADVYSFAMVLYELLTVRPTTFVPSDREPLLSAQRRCFCRWTGHITAILAGAPSSRDTSASTLYRSGRVRTTSALRYTPHVPLNGKG